MAKMEIDRPCCWKALSPLWLAGRISDHFNISAEATSSSLCGDFTTSHMLSSIEFQPHVITYGTSEDSGQSS